MALTTAIPGSQGGIRLRRATGTVVGRAIELAAIEEMIEAARNGIASVSFEGEPGIGKSRLLVAAAEMAAAHDFVPATVAADEELRGPFMLARGLFANEDLRDGASPAVVAALDRACEVLGGRDDTGLSGLAPEDRVLRVIDQATVALRTAALERPVAILLDDVQWADQDSLRLLRYVIRTQPALPLFVAFGIRPEESAHAPELVTLLADMDRMGIIKRLRVHRFRQADSGDLLRQLLKGPITPASVAAIQAQAEGVPFVIEELAKTYRDAGLLTTVDGQWTLAPRAGRLVPSSVRTLVQRRAAHLPEDTRNVLADAAILGRTFRARDVCAIRNQLGQTECTSAGISELLAPAIEAGLLGSGSDAAANDYTFSHEQVHDFAAGLLTPARRRSIHAAIVDLLSAGDQADPAALAALARHALAAGDVDRAARYSIEAAKGAIAANAPDEALRVIEAALTSVSASQARIALLQARDDAYDMLGRVDDRLEGLTELAALAEASRDDRLAADVMLRRAAALRLDEQQEQAAEVARAVRSQAVARGDERQELAACIELGQDLLRSTIGEGFSPTPLESDIDGADEAYRRAEVLAEKLGDKRLLAAVSRELAVIITARVRIWFIERFRAGEHIDILKHIAAGGQLEEIMPGLPIADDVRQATVYLQRALELYEELDDRRGAMSTIIALAYVAWAPDVHVGPTPARRIEEIRRLSSRLRTLSHESERAAAEAQMVYGVHVFCRSKVIPDLAVQRGREAHALARGLGDRFLEFLAADGTAAACRELGDLTEARQWLDRAAAVAAAAPTPHRGLQVEVSRGLLAAAGGDVPTMHQHLRKALEMAAGQDRRAARAEILAAYALECLRLGDASEDAALLEEAATRAQEAARAATGLPGRPPWALQADAVLAATALAHGENARALDLARRVIAARRDAEREDPHLELLIPIGRVMLAVGDEAEAAAMRDELQLTQALIAQRTFDPDVRARWFRSPTGRAIASLAGPVAPRAQEQAEPTATGQASDEARLMGLLIEGRSNAEIGEELAMTPAAVGQALAGMYARLGASSRAEATVMALSGAV